MKFFATLVLLTALLPKSSGFDLKCVFTNHAWFSHKTCVVENINIVDPSQIVTSINGQTQADHRDVKALLIESQVVKFFPRGIQKFFPYLEDISIYFSQLQAIEKADLKPFRNLQALRLFNNELESLDGDLFESNRELRVIDFDHNKLKVVGSGLLTELKKLEQAHFRHNTCIHKGARSSSKVFHLIVELEKRCEMSKETKILRLESKVKSLQNQISMMKFLEHEELKMQLNTLYSRLTILISFIISGLSSVLLFYFYDFNYAKYIL